MVAKKCVKCKKNITKKVPGLECSRCEVIIHADPACSKLSNKQLNTLKNVPGIEWSCDECLKNISRRSSFVIPEDDGDDEDYEPGSSGGIQAIDAKKLVQDISREVKKTFREEIGNLENSLDYLSEQLTTLEQSINKQDSRIKELENKNHDLYNKNKNLELRVTVLEQGLKDFEQKSLSNSLEIAGLPDIMPNNVHATIEALVSKLDVENKDIQFAQRLPGSKDKPGPILVELRSKILQQQWIDASRNKCVTVGMVVSDAPKEKADERFFVREALTKHQKTLLFNAKTQLLNKSCQYVWCKNGKGKKGGGIMIYVRNHLRFTLVQQKTNTFESLSGIIKINSSPNVIVCAIYRPPSTNKNLFVNELSKYITKFELKHNLILIGDTNIDLKTSNSYKDSYLEALSERGLMCGISDYTRIETRKGIITKSCLDHIFARFPTLHPFSAVLDVALADHRGVIFACVNDVPLTPELIQGETKKMVDYGVFYKELKNMDWSKYRDINSPDEKSTRHR
ncbi:unnamed protein product [Leptosia nina]|uniref:Endonuclease/exonuclease/phosphatase domain-containing protein n=1 Tax=Leptosia nina TaxID=320188 RepID=A0AAV1JNT5_9NEOP